MNENKAQTEIMMIDEQCIYLYDFMMNDLRVILDFNNEFGFKMSESPQLFVLNDAQTIAFVSTALDTLIIDIVQKNQQESEINYEKIFEVDNIYNISEVKQCIFADKRFFVVANQRNNQKGLFLLSINENPFGEKKLDNCPFEENEHSYKEHVERDHN